MEFINEPGQGTLIGHHDEYAGGRFGVSVQFEQPGVTIPEDQQERLQHALNFVALRVRQILGSPKRAPAPPPQRPAGELQTIGAGDVGTLEVGDEPGPPEVKPGHCSKCDQDRPRTVTFNGTTLCEECFYGVRDQPKA